MVVVRPSLKAQTEKKKIVGQRGWPEKAQKKKQKSLASGGGQTILVGLGVASATLNQPIWVAEATPWPLGVVRPPLRLKLKKKKRSIEGALMLVC
jgi:hypothetical protein